ncbi:hypothetical protein BVRB_011690 [Beta vulgaris subsp. vulgaris]|uniref:Uncharacterized protein n=1 Tax=Beta vulgaris subsp. vulgaris TaxID=3555 RepID=A0A0J8B5J2_BETVV|nr:hypothetical protein BVRB_011690 [Beta vulgaris subsp. vulgaris]
MEVEVEVEVDEYDTWLEDLMSNSNEDITVDELNHIEEQMNNIEDSDNDSRWTTNGACVSSESYPIVGEDGGGGSSVGDGGCKYLVLLLLVSLSHSSVSGATSPTKPTSTGDVFGRHTSTLLQLLSLTSDLKSEKSSSS